MNLTFKQAQRAYLTGELIAARQLAASYERSLRRMRPGLARRRLRAAWLLTRARIRALELQLKARH